MSYCQAGETARVTFPDGSIRDFSAPIDISCDDELPCVPDSPSLIYTFRMTGTTKGYGDGTYNVVEPWEMMLSTPIFVNANTPYKGFQVVTTNVNTWANYTGRPYLSGSVKSHKLLVSHGVNSTCNISTVEYGERFPSDSLGSVTLVSIKEKNNPSKTVPVLKNIKVKNALGSILHEAFYESCAYSVECIIPCPPNTLDCGGCCLDCASIFNQLSALTKKALSIK